MQEEKLIELVRKLQGPTVLLKAAALEGFGVSCIKGWVINRQYMEGLYIGDIYIYM